MPSFSSFSSISVPSLLTNGMSKYQVLYIAPPYLCFGAAGGQESLTCLGGGGMGRAATKKSLEEGCERKTSAHSPLPNISSEIAILSTSPVKDTLVFRLSIPEVPSNTWTTARLPKTSRILF